MRNQQTPIIRENVFYPEIEPLCNGPRPSEDSAPGKVAMCIIKSERQERTCDQLEVGSIKKGACYLDSQVNSQRDNSLLAQPVFVLEKKDRPFKRHAEEPTAGAENSLCVHPAKRFRSSSFTFRPSQSSTDTDRSVLQKRVRSSSFTLVTSFPPNQPVLKNNVFMPSSLLQEQRSCADAGKLHSGAVLQPATLLPPPITACRDVQNTGAAAIFTRQENKTQEVKTKTPVINDGQPKSPPGSACTLGIETRMRPVETIFMTQKHNVDFIFGENMERRVKNPKRPTASQSSACKRELPSSRISCNRDWPYQRRRSRMSLIESAAAYTSKPKVKYELNQVEVVTGEEAERNVLQINCILYVFNKETLAWTERGHGYLRLNDTATRCNGPLRSRIVMRNHGNLKLILNSKIFKGMKLDKANRRCVSFTATDLADYSLKIFLVKGSAEDAVRLYAAIHHRLIALRSPKDQEQEWRCPKSDATAKSLIRLLNSDSEDEEEDEMLLYPSKISDHQQWIRQRRPVLYS